MEEAFENARQELKRVDHLYYVSLKYTRTVDMMRHMVERMMNCILYVVEGLLLFKQKRKKTLEIPSNLPLRASLAQEVFADDERIQSMINLYLMLGKFKRSPYTSREEFRRHVTMISEIEGETVELNIDILGEYYEQLQEHYTYCKNLAEGNKGE